MSLEDIKTQKKSSVASENNKALLSAKSLAKEYPFFIFLPENLNSEKLQTLLSEKSNRFSTSIDNSMSSFVKLEETDPSNQALIESIVNAFCNSEVIEKVTDSLLNRSSQ